MEFNKHRLEERVLTEALTVHCVLHPSKALWGGRGEGNFRDPVCVEFASMCQQVYNSTVKHWSPSKTVLKIFMREQDQESQSITLTYVIGWDKIKGLVLWHPSLYLLHCLTGLHGTSVQDLQNQNFTILGGMTSSSFLNQGPGTILVSFL